MVGHVHECSKDGEPAKYLSFGDEIRFHDKLRPTANTTDMVNILQAPVQRIQPMLLAVSTFLKFATGLSLPLLHVYSLLS